MANRRTKKIRSLAYENQKNPESLKQFAGGDDSPESVKAREKKAWSVALKVAKGVYYGNLDDFVEGATHYHAYYVNPSWAETKTYITRIDDHIFYRWENERRTK